MADLFTMGDKHYMHANGNGNGEAGDYLPFNNVLSATTFNDSSNNHSTGLGRQIDDSPDMFTEAVLEEVYIQQEQIDHSLIQFRSPQTARLPLRTPWATSR